MKIFVFLLTLWASSITHAAPVEGDLFYKLPSGDIANREVVIDVPARGVGEVILSGNGFEWRTTNFWSESSMGQTLFFAAFQEEFMGNQSTVVLKGTYMNGTNRILYYGDFYKTNNHDPVPRDLSGFVHGGGFRFDYAR